MTFADKRKSNGIAHALIAVMLGLGLWGFTLVWGSESSASILCRNLEEQQVCIETIKRSAKYNWEYQVVVRVDGKNQSIKRYDCRPSTDSDQELATSNFEAALRQFICDRVTH